MSILTTDISRLGGCLIGDFFHVEVTSLNEENYELAYRRAYGREDAVMARRAPLQKFEEFMWDEPKDDAALQREVELMTMPDVKESVLKDYIGHQVLNVLRRKLHNDINIGYGRQIMNDTITLAATYMFKDDSMFTVQLVRIRLFEK